MLAPGVVVGTLNQDRVDVETMEIRQTPTFFVNGRPLDPFGEAELRRSGCGRGRGGAKLRST